ncbi:hypothetical protein SLA2020_112440 [Shorea laevis]
MFSKCSPRSQNQAAGKSVTDSGIENRNGSLRRATDLRIAERIWAFAKEIGVGNQGNKTEVIQRIKDMEDHDRKLCRILKVSKVALKGYGCTKLK